MNFVEINFKEPFNVTDSQGGKMRNLLSLEKYFVNTPTYNVRTIIYVLRNEMIFRNFYEVNS